MRPSLPPSRSAHPRSPAARKAAVRCVSAEALLGLGHPLVTVLSASLTALEQVLAVAASQAVGAILLYEQVALGLPLVIASGFVQTALGCRVALLASRRREICRGLIIAGHERLALADVELECRRLGGARLRSRLARSIEEVADIGAGRRFDLRIGPPLFHLRVLRQVAPELREVGRLLRDDRASVRGVALVEWLMTSGESPLYGAQLQLLRQELGRARYLLSQRAEGLGR